MQSAMTSRQAMAPASATRRCVCAEWERWRECGDAFMVSPRAAWGVCGAFARDRWFDCRNFSVYRRAGGSAKHECRFKERLIVGSWVLGGWWSGVRWAAGFSGLLRGVACMPEAAGASGSGSEAGCRASAQTRGKSASHSSTPRSSAVGRITLSFGINARRSSSFHGCSLPAPASTASESLKFWMNQSGHNGDIADRASSAIQ